MNIVELMQGDCLHKLREIHSDSVDAIVTDPPYGLSFMSKKWDYDVPSVEIWREVLRVLKPGGHLLSFGGTRTYHRMVVNIEDAGFEIRDQVMWLYGSGFPKSHDISKAIDKQAGAEREVIGSRKADDIRGGNLNHRLEGDDKTHIINITAPATDEAKKWAGYGTALKPANEPIVLARKPLEKGLTIAQNVLRWGTGALNIDASRIGNEQIEKGRAGRGVASSTSYHDGLKPTDVKAFATGRWPANALFDEAAAATLDQQAEASRFFYVAKTSKRERGNGNNHPTVKPIKLMTYLIQLITPPNGVVLDPFMGSGSTGIAAKTSGFGFIGIEREQEYFAIAQARIAAG